MNNINLIGKIVSDIEEKSINDYKFVEFRIEVYRTKNKNDRFSCLAYGNTARIIKDYCSKGNMIGLSGSGQMFKEYIFDTQGNRTVYDKFKIKVYQVTFIANKDENIIFTDGFDFQAKVGKEDMIEQSIEENDKDISDKLYDHREELKNQKIDDIDYRDSYSDEDIPFDIDDLGLDNEELEENTEFPSEENQIPE